MKIGTLCTIGNSTGVVIPQSHLRQLGWSKGDQLQQAVLGNTLTITNVTQRLVQITRTRKAFGNGGTRHNRPA